MYHTITLSTWSQVKSYFKNLTSFNVINEVLTGRDKYVEIRIEPEKSLFHYEVINDLDSSIMVEGISENPIFNIIEFINSQNKIHIKHEYKQERFAKFFNTIDDIAEEIIKNGWMFHIEKKVSRQPIIKINIDDEFEVEIKMSHIEYDVTFKTSGNHEIVADGMTYSPIEAYTEFYKRRDVKKAILEMDKKYRIDSWESYDDSSDETSRILPEESDLIPMSFKSPVKYDGPETMRSGYTLISSFNKMRMRFASYFVYKIPENGKS